MKKLFSLSFVTAFTASAAVAGNLNLDARFDYDNVGYNSDHSSAASNGKSDFKMHTGRLDYKGKYNEDLSYRLRARFNSNDPSLRQDNLSGEVDYAYFSNKVSETATITLGKFASELGGFDGSTSGADLYLKSGNYSSIHDGAKYGSTTIAGKKASITGAKASLGFGDHELAIFAANNTEGSTVPAQTRLLQGLVFKGQFLDKTLLANVGYASEKANGGTGSAAANLEANYNYTSLGLKYETSAWLASIDLASNAYGKVTISSVTNDVTQAATVVNFGYHIDNVTLRLMVDSSTYSATPTSGASGKIVTSGTSLGAEYKPTGDKNFRYHAAYTNLTTAVDGATSTPVETHVVLGMRLYADFLK